MPCKKIKVLHLNYKYTPRDTDLTHAVTQALLMDPLFRVTTAYLEGSDALNMTANDTACLHHFFDFQPKLLKGTRLKILKNLIQFCKTHQFDVVITHRFKPCYLLALVGLIVKFKKKISIFHGSGEFDRFYRKILARILMRSFKLVAVSEAVKTDLLQAGCGFKSQQITIIHNAIHASAIEQDQLSKEQARSALNLAPDQFFFGQIARLVPVKGQIYLLHAFHQLNAPNAQLVIIGSGRSEQDLRLEIAKLHLEERVHLLGEVPNAYRYMKAFDVFILSSIKEGFGVVLLEAMAASLPIIATKVEGVPEVLDGLAPLCNAKNSAELAALMQHFYQLDKDALALQGRQLNKRLYQQFDISQYQQAFQELCKIE